MKNDPIPATNRQQTAVPGFVGRFINPLMESFGLSRMAATTAFVFILVLVGLAMRFFISSAPPSRLILTSGPEGSSFSTNAAQYQALLASNGVKLEILTSEGSEQNLQRLSSGKSGDMVGFVQGGITNFVENGVTNTPDRENIVSLGSLFYVPVFVFYRGEPEVTILSSFKGKRISVGLSGSGTHALALSLLQLNGINLTNHSAEILEIDAERAVAGLTNGTVDAAFLMGDSASRTILRSLLASTNIHVMDFSQADAYTRTIPYLNKLVLPMGAFDFGKNLPPHDLHLIGPTVELLARKSLHPALSDLLIDAAQQIHGSPALLRKPKEFPNPTEHEFPISGDAARFYKSGKSFLYQKLPFWEASLLNRILVVFLPLIVVLIPGLRAIPAFFKWRLRLQLYRRYRMLLALEREMAKTGSRMSHAEINQRIDEIEASVNQMKLPASFADQFYGLRGHIALVRSELQEMEEV